jgi:hypothetical protein
MRELQIRKHARQRGLRALRNLHEIGDDGD